MKKNEPSKVIILFCRVIHFNAYSLSIFPQCLQGTVQWKHSVSGRTVRIDSVSVGTQRQPGRSVFSRRTTSRTVLERARRLLVPQEVGIVHKTIYVIYS